MNTTTHPTEAERLAEIRLRYILQNAESKFAVEAKAYGYGTGESYTLDALKRFMAKIPAEEGECYDFREFELALTPSVAWLLINALCKADILEYGTSPRFGWLTRQGRALQSFVSATSLDELVVICCRPEGYVVCYPDYCNCDGRECDNPFWKAHRALSPKTTGSER